MESTFFYLGIYLLVFLTQFVSCRVDSYGGWNNAKDTQYHIQTDEGDERYFKYQTKSGQYRKEKRLQDGSVVGTYGWVDQNGYLRLRDYVADDGGYRIVKTKMVYVGSTPEEVQPAAPVRNYQTNSVTLIPSQQNTRYQTYVQPTRLYPTPTRVYAPPLLHNYFSSNYQSTTPASTVQLKASYSPNQVAPVIHYFPLSTPVVDISPNSISRFSTPLFLSTTPAPSVAVYKEADPRPVAVYSSTPKPVAVNYVSSTESPSHVSSTPSYVSSTPSYVSSTARPDPTLSAIGYTASTPSPRPIAAPISGKFARPVHNDFVTETEKNKLFLKSEGGYYRKRYVDQAGQGSQVQEYDGVSTVQNGFRYFLPRHYHEEASSSDGQDRTGSFGYIDPFGIRRVVYYNTSPGRGFVHRKNNRYVGFNATPYDPRP